MHATTRTTGTTPKPRTSSDAGPALAREAASAPPLPEAPPAPAPEDAGEAAPAEAMPATASAAGEDCTATERPTAVIPLSWDGATWLFGGFEADVEGVFVATHDPLALGTEADVVLVLPDGAHVAAHGTVVLAKQADHRDPHEADHHGDGWPGYGLRFTAVEDDGLDRLARLGKRRHPLFYPD